MRPWITLLLRPSLAKIRNLGLVSVGVFRYSRLMKSIASVRTLALLASFGLLWLVASPAALRAEEGESSVASALSSTTLGGTVDTSVHWTPGAPAIPEPSTLGLGLLAASAWWLARRSRARP